MLWMDATLLGHVPRGAGSRCLIRLELVDRWLLGALVSIQPSRLLRTSLCQFLIHRALFFHCQLREVVDELAIEHVELGLTLRARDFSESLASHRVYLSEPSLRSRLFLLELLHPPIPLVD